MNLRHLPWKVPLKLRSLGELNKFCKYLSGNEIRVLCMFVLNSLIILVRILVCVLSSSVVSSSLWFPWTVAHKAPLSMEFSRQEYWSELPFPSPGNHPGLEIEPTSVVAPALAGVFFHHSATWEGLWVLRSEKSRKTLREFKWVTW